jgi:hypothetical protein
VWRIESVLVVPVQWCVFRLRKFVGQRFLIAGGFDAGGGIRRTCSMDLTSSL